MPEKGKQNRERIVTFLLIAAAIAAYCIGSDSRTFWPYMLSAYLLGTLVHTTLPAPAPGLGDYLFPRDVWLHKSSVNDFYVSLINKFIFVVVLGVTFLSPDKIVVSTKEAVEHFLAIAPSGPAPPVSAVVAYTLVSLLVSDLFYYFSHRLAHAVPALWEFHKVHHSAKVMTPFTLYRMHPLDNWLNLTFRAVGMGLTAAVFLHFYPGLKGAIMVAGVNIGLFVTDILGSNLRHSHIWLSFGSKLEHILISPAQHQIHHSENPKHFNKNYASMFSLWDWAFGSLYVPQEREELTFGLGSEKDEAPYQSVPDMYLHPVLQLVKRLSARQ